MSRAMKDSGIPWIGEIPKNWNTPLLKGVFREREEKSTFGEETLLSLSQYTGIKPKSETEIADSHIAANYEGYKVVHKGDFVMNIMLAWNGSYAVSDYDGMISPAYCVYYFRDNSNKKYYHYLLRINGYQAAFKTLSRGIIDSRLRLYPEQFYTFPTLQPPLSEQQRIAEFLDRKCGEIDEAIALQEEFIEELKSYKQSVITEAVTRGLNPNVKLKDSSIDWIGKIPQGWDIRRIKTIGTAKNGLTYSPSDISSEENGILVLRSSNIQNGKLYFDDNVFVSIKIPTELMVHKGDLIICSRNGSAALVGKCAMVEDENLVATYGAFMMRFQSQYTKRYLYYLLTSAITQYKPLFTTTTINQLTTGILGSLAAPFTSSQTEQQQIADYLDNKCAEIDSLIAIKQQKIEELKDYKKSIVYEYVTGKKEAYV